MNPEFRRQLWLQFSPIRLALMPVLLLACFAAVALADGLPRRDAMAALGAVLFMGLVWGMGTLAAGSSIMDEMTDRTWDQQRMSAMQPWAMTWGKLAGASAYGWYGGALCLLVAIPSGLMGEHRAQVGLASLGLILTGIFLPALLIAVNLQFVKVGGRMARRGGVWTLLLLVMWGLGPLFATLRNGGVVWWQQPFNPFEFAVASMALFALCALVAAWRSMAEVLAVRQLPWGWPALALLTTTYLAGFATDPPLPVFAVAGLATCLALTYFALLTEPQPRPLWQRIVTRMADQQWRAALQQLPRWPTTLALALPFAVWVMLSADAPSSARGHLLEQLRWQPLCVLLLLVRDCALALFFAFEPRSRRPLLGFFVLMFVLYGLLPWFIGVAGSPTLMGLVQPMLAAGGFALVVAMAHAVLALVLLIARWKATAP